MIDYYAILRKMLRKVGGGARRGTRNRQPEWLIPTKNIEDSKGLSPLAGFGAEPRLGCNPFPFMP